MALNVVFKFAMFFILVKRAKRDFVVLCPQCYSENVTRENETCRCDNCQYKGALNAGHR